MVRQYIKIFFIAILLITISITGCANKKNQSNNKTSEDKTNELIGNTKVYNIEQIEKIKDTEELFLIKLKTSKDINSHFNELYKQKIIYENADLIKVTINIISKDEKIKEIIYSNIDIQIHPKLEILKNDVKMVKNNESKIDIYGEIMIKNKNLEEYEKKYFEDYSNSYPDRIKYTNDYINIKFNKGDDN
ncbi:hypothetical protein HMPREF1983_01372 [Gemella bergeri ATCC 700627]|uniref:Lipoprotein n=1 Tax=Gemella bergeri ATCC 700627 TaxID=1321820 RepID=U2QIW0_9BACL|nr:hypothetical protein [Gemella bergeri]ERK56411.1 hypothetical protein HMPREF1983_01372 [Gemella bergeri ATCC 700627]